MIFNHILIFTIKSNSFKKAIRRGYFYPGYHSFFSRVRRLSAEMFRDRQPVHEKTLAPSRAFQALF
ncbi:unnamed protein product [Porites evermanni]|uniref:Uncharacterized protein n=1 Tax=Porites evermanni TaxID=104178 RepID=A0ABN8LIG2_9CNID|nr:unnamed protein product [Porites evermanni]